MIWNHQCLISFRVTVALASLKFGDCDSPLVLSGCRQLDVVAWDKLTSNDDLRWLPAGQPVPGHHYYQNYRCSSSHHTYWTSSLNSQVSLFHWIRILVWHGSFCTVVYAQVFLGYFLPSPLRPNITISNFNTWISSPVFDVNCKNRWIHWINFTPGSRLFETYS